MRVSLTQTAWVPHKKARVRWGMLSAHRVSVATTQTKPDLNCIVPVKM
jgi:hypothetical protein